MDALVVSHRIPVAAAAVAVVAAAVIGAAVGAAAVTASAAARKRHHPPQPPPEQQDTPAGATHARCRERIYAERAGRIAAERTIRNELVRAVSSFAGAGFPSLVIGTVLSPFVGKRGTPRFVLFIFHQNTNLPKVLLRSFAEGSRGQEAAGGDSSAASPPGQDGGGGDGDAIRSRSATLRLAGFNGKVPTFGAKVYPPLLKGGSTGVFATRSPHHPNPFGLSLVRVLHVDAAAREIAVAGLDMCDGTPVLDLKPWNPADCPACLHATVSHSRAWAGAGCPDPACQHSPEADDDCDSLAAPATVAAVSLPGWVARGIQDPYELDVEFSEAASRELAAAVGSGRLAHYGAGQLGLVRAALRKILSLDIRSFHQGRGKHNAVVTPADMAAEDTGRDQEWELDYDALNVKFSVKQAEGDGGPRLWVSVDSIRLRDF
ncbi:hypothetical protein HK405_010568 [Cladochytrium tenue]|nr:hypothetical protein HK405_010568 [Cladochytrium tenue]